MASKERAQKILAELRQRAVQVGAGAGLEERIAIFGADAVGAATELRANADFFLYAAAVAGLPLSLAEAMLAGLPLVTTITSGVADLLPQEAAVPILTGRGTLDPEDEPIARFLPLTTHPPTAEAVRDAIFAAAALDEAARSRLGAASRAIAERRFGLAAFKVGLRAISGILTLDAP